MFFEIRENSDIFCGRCQGFIIPREDVKKNDWKCNSTEMDFSCDM